MGIFLIILILLFLLWPAISRWMQRYMARKAEDFLRNATGMPPRPDSRKARKQASAGSRERASRSSFYRAHRRDARPGSYADGPIIPREYAEDVEFVETKEFSSPTGEMKSESRVSEFHESQVSDAEWEDVK